MLVTVCLLGLLGTLAEVTSVCGVPGTVPSTLPIPRHHCLCNTQSPPLPLGASDSECLLWTIPYEGGISGGLHIGQNGVHVLPPGTKPSRVVGDRSREILFVFRPHPPSWVQTSLSSNPSAALQVTEMATGFCPVIPGPGDRGQGPTSPQSQSPL